MIQGTSAMDRPVDRKRSLPRRLLLPAAVAVGLVLVGVVVYPVVTRWFLAERSVSLQRIRLGEIVRGDLERDLSVQGRIVAAYHPTTSSPASGLVSLLVKAGEVVQEGQVLAVVRSPEVDSRLKQEESTLLSMQSDLERQKIASRQQMLASAQGIDMADVELEAARRAMDRANRSRTEGIINAVEYEEAEDDLRRAELSLRHARQDADLERETLEFELRNRELQVERQSLVVAELQRQVDRLQVRSPVAGLVSRLDVNDHDAVERGQPLVTVVDLSEFEIEVMIPESYADEIGPGTPAQVTYSGELFEGQVKSISPEVEGTQVRGIVAFTVDPPQGLRQNQRVSTRLILERKTDVLKVARGPFLENGGGREAYVVDGSIAVRRPIRTGASSVSEIEIVSGLEPGDRIIISETGRFQEAERIYLRD